MDTKELERFCPWARVELVGAVRRGMVQLGVDEAGRAQWPAGSEAVAGRALSPEERERRDRLMAAAAAAGDAAFAEREAYSWFNRLMALRYMELHGLLPWGGRALSAADGSFPPELATRAADLPLASLDRAAYLEHAAESDDEGAFRLALEAACAELAGALPGVFEGASCDLLPKGLLARGEHSMIQHLVEDVPEDSWEDVEALGWAYQFYNSELKADFLNSKRKARPEDLAPATQIFTPDWIVRYMVQNTLGRLWMLNNPESPLRDKMEFYIEPDAGHEDFLRVSGPEEITFCDPACGSGHILVYAFQLLTEMYRERGWRDRDIARSILEKNLSGYEIDPRAAQIAQTALCMEALSLDRRWLSRGVAADVRVLQNIELDEGQLPDTYVKKDLADAIRHLGEVGSLVNPSETDLAALDAAIADAGAADLLGSALRGQLQEARSQLDALSRQFDIVVANPPYLGSKSFQPFLTKWMRDNYPDEKSDLCNAFINRICGMKKPGGEAGITATNSWMFLSSSEASRKKTLDKNEITSLVQLSVHGFKGIAAQIFAFTLIDKQSYGYKGGYVRLNDFDHHSLQEAKTLEAIRNPDCGWFYRADASTFHDIPGSPIAYWASDAMHVAFKNGTPLADVAKPRQGLATGNNNLFLRSWWETGLYNTCFDATSREAALASSCKWFPCNKGGGFRKWYGNNVFVVNWEDDGSDIRSYADLNGKLLSRPQNMQYYFQEGMTWGTISSSKLSMRYSPSGFLFETKGSMCFANNEQPIELYLGLTNTSIEEMVLSAVSPTLDFHEGPLGKTPVNLDPIADNSGRICTLVHSCVDSSKTDWDSQETSWDFKRNPLL